MTEERKGTLAIVAAAAGYGFLSVLLKLALEAGAGVLPLAAWRFVLAAVFVWILLLVRRRPVAPRAAWPALAGLGAIYAVNALAFVAALRTVPAATATLVFYVYPVPVVLLAALFLGEPFTRRKAIGAALATAGCILTAGAGLEGGDARGIGLVLLSTLSLSIYIVAGRKLLARLPSHGAAAVVVTATAVACAAAALLGGDLRLGGGA